MLGTVRPWVDTLLEGRIDAKKRNTLAHIVSGIIEGKTVVPAEIGKHVVSAASDKDRIKQVDRFLGNTGFDVRAVSEGLLACFDFAPRQRVGLALDWTKLGPFWMMTTSVVTGSRALPFHWTIIHPKKLRMLVVQKWHIEELKAMLPPDVEFILLFDAGYDDVDFLRCLIDSNVKFIVRSSSTVCIREKGKKWVNLSKTKLERGRLYDWGTVDFTKDHELEIRVIGFHDHGMADPWLLVTNLQDTGEWVVKLYGRRFETEETYKDFKDVRSGLQLKGTRVTDPHRLARLVAAQAVAYYLMVLCGLYGEELNLHRKMQANTIKHRRVVALWRVGRNLIRNGKVQFHGLLSRLKSLLEALGVSLGGRFCHRYG